MLIPAATRLQGIFFWDLLVYLLEGLIFLITGMQTRTLLDRVNADMLSNLLLAVFITVVVVVVTRFIWMFPAAYLPRWLSPSLRRRDPRRPGSGFSCSDSSACAASSRLPRRSPFR